MIADLFRSFSVAVFACTVAVILVALIIGVVVTFGGMSVLLFGGFALVWWVAHRALRDSDF